MPPHPTKGDFYAALVWIVSAISLVIYGTLTLTNQHVPGVEQLVDYLSTVKGVYIFGAAFLSIFIEGLYLVGSFFPGSTLVVLLSIISQFGGPTSYLVTIGVIFFGWCSAGVVNILIAKLYGATILRHPHDATYEVKDRLFTTWFPAFRANYEVAQIAEGGNPYLVFWSSVKVKFLVSLFMLLVMAIVPFIIDVNKISNAEGSFSIFAVAGISFVVGAMKIHSYVKRSRGTASGFQETLN